MNKVDWVKKPITYSYAEFYGSMTLWLYGWDVQPD
jgi:hypothetical protein